MARLTFLLVAIVLLSWLPTAARQSSPSRQAWFANTPARCSDPFALDVVYAAKRWFPDMPLRGAAVNLGQVYLEISSRDFRMLRSQTGGGNERHILSSQDARSLRLSLAERAD